MSRIKFVEDPASASLANWAWSQWLDEGPGRRSPLVLASPALKSEYPRTRVKPSVLIMDGKGRLLCLLHAKRASMSLLAGNLDIDDVVALWRGYARAFVVSTFDGQTVRVLDSGASRKAIRELKSVFYLPPRAARRTTKRAA